MSDEPSAACTLRLQQLRQEFALTLPGRVSELRQLQHDLTSELSTDVLNELERRAHKLAGTLSTFEFPQLSAVCRALEHDLRHPPERTALLALIDAHLTHLEHLLSAPPASTPTF